MKDFDEKILNVRHYSAGYEIRTRLIDGSQFGSSDFVMKSAYTPDGNYIGESRLAYQLCKTRGIKPEPMPKEFIAGCNDGDSGICSIGFSEKEQKWYGWSHRAMYGFGIGYVVKKGSCCASPGVTEEWLRDHPEDDFSLPVGFKVKTLADAKRAAIAFADSVG